MRRRARGGGQSGVIGWGRDAYGVVGALGDVVDAVGVLCEGGREVSGGEVGVDGHEEGFED